MLCEPPPPPSDHHPGADAGADAADRDRGAAEAADSPAAEDSRGSAAESPTLAGIGSLFSECDADGGSDRSAEDDAAADGDRPAAPCTLLPHTGLVAFDDDDASPTASSSAASSPHSRGGEEEEYFDQEEDECEEYDTQFSGLHHEQASDDHDDGECSEAEDRAVPFGRSRYSGHPLGVERLEQQHREVQDYKQQLFEEWAAGFRNENRWTDETSRARAKVLVSEAFQLEKECLRLQREWLRSAESGVKPGPTRRFGEAYQYPSPCFQTHGPDVLADPVLHRKIVDDKSRTLVERWRNIGRQVAEDMAEYDNFGSVIKNLSTMRIFLEGQQSMNYCIDMSERQRRITLYQSVIDLVHTRDDGFFLKDALPRRGELCPGTPRPAKRWDS